MHIMRILLIALMRIVLVALIRRARQAMRRDALRRKADALKLKIKASKSSLYQRELQSRKRVRQGLVYRQKRVLKLRL